MDLEHINAYINDFYANTAQLSKESYAKSTDYKDFIPTIDTEVARFISLIIELKDVKSILEIGTSIGYSTTTMAKAIKGKGGKVTTIEYDEKVGEKAKQNFIREGVSDVIEVINGDARRILPLLTTEYDLIFQDAEKTIYPEVYEDCIRLLKMNGLLIADDTLFDIIDLDEKWDHLKEPIRNFNKLLANDNRLRSTILPIGDGISIAVKIPT
jgi:predicted O-methyltransferase YrrM